MIDETGASQMLVPEGKRKKKITVKEIEATVATMARIPPKTVTKSDAEVLINLEKDLKRVVFGQDKAIEALASAIKLSRAGLREPEKPIGCYLFSGPTGVGKTEVAKQLADLMGIELLRFDMSEYMEKHTVEPPHRRASGLCRLRPGRPADRRHRPASALRAAARRDREGASGPVQHPVAGDGPRQAHRPQRQVGRLPQRHPDHDDERGRLRHGQAGDGLQLEPSARARTRRRSTGCSRRSSATVSMRSSPFAGLPPEVITKVVEKFIFQLEAQLADRGVHDRAVGGGARKWIAREGLRREVRRPSARPRHPGAHQEAARRRAAVRQARARRHGEGRRRRQGRGPQARASSTWPPIRPSGRRPRARTTRTRTSRRRCSSTPPRARRCRARRRKRNVRPRSTGTVPNVPRRKDE